MPRLARAPIALVALALCLLARSVSSAIRKCPKRCRCTEQRNGDITVDCASVGLKRFPKVLPEQVTHLLLQHNNIQKIHDQPGAFPYLKQLNLARNSLKSLDSKPFATMPYLTSLDISGNELTALSSNTFAGLNRLTDLRLSANKFPYMDNVTVAFDHLKNLLDLTLSGNRIAGGISNNQFHQLEALRTLDLSHLRLRSLPGEAFGRLRNLRRLDVSYNDLEEFPYEAVSKIPQTASLILDVRHNKIGSFHRDKFDAIAKKHQPKIEGNPLVCDCSTVFLWEKLKFDWGNKDIYCHSPPALSGVQLYYLKRTDLVCQDTLSFAATPSNVTTGCHGMPATIDCRLAAGLESAPVRWKKNGVPLPVDECQDKYQLTCTGSLIVRDVTTKDVGDYACYAGDGDSRIESPPGQLDVNSACYKETATPETVPPTSAECDDEDDCSCADDGSGSGSGCAVKFCPCPPSIRHASTDSNCSDDTNDGKYLPDDEVSYKCNRGYILEGSSRITCRKDGTWSNRLPRCQLACGRKMVDDNALLSRAMHLGDPTYATDNKGRVANGDRALKGEWPWTGLMSIDDSRIWCGATLISHTLAVTAAHCVVLRHTGKAIDVESSKVEVSFGKQAIDRTEHSQQIRRVKRVYIHRRYDSRTLDFDIAILELDVAVTFNTYVQPACVSERDWAFERRDEDAPSAESSSNNDLKSRGVPWGVVSGFGYTTADETDAKTLRKALVTFADLSVCHEAMQNISGVTMAMICAYGPGDTCQGDSGGPLVVVSDGRWYLVGVTSWGDRCGTDGKYGVYARVANPEINSWIHETWERAETT